MDDLEALESGSFKSYADSAGSHSVLPLASKERSRESARAPLVEDLVNTTWTSHEIKNTEVMKMEKGVDNERLRRLKQRQMELLVAVASQRSDAEIKDKLVAIRKEMGD